MFAEHVARMEQERGSRDPCVRPRELCTAQLRGAPATCTTVSSARLSLPGYPPGPGVGDEARGAPGSLSVHAEDLVFALSEAESYCQEGSEPEYDSSGPLLTGSLGREHTEQGKVGSRRPGQRPAVCIVFPSQSHEVVL